MLSFLSSLDSGALSDHQKLHHAPRQKLHHAPTEYSKLPPSEPRTDELPPYQPCCLKPLSSFRPGPNLPQSSRFRRSDHLELHKAPQPGAAKLPPSHLVADELPPFQPRTVELIPSKSGAGEIPPLHLFSRRTATVFHRLSLEPPSSFLHSLGR